jgi:hypothetical protein
MCCAMAPRGPADLRLAHHAVLALGLFSRCPCCTCQRRGEGVREEEGRREGEKEREEGRVEGRGREGGRERGREREKGQRSSRGRGSLRRAHRLARLLGPDGQCKPPPHASSNVGAHLGPARRIPPMVIPSRSERKQACASVRVCVCVCFRVYFPGSSGDGGGRQRGGSSRYGQPRFVPGALRQLRHGGWVVMLFFGTEEH